MHSPRPNSEASDRAVGIQNMSRLGVLPDTASGCNGATTGTGASCEDGVLKVVLAVARLVVIMP